MRVGHVIRLFHDDDGAKSVNASPHLLHGLQLPLFVVVGRLQLLHPLRQVVLLGLLPLPELFAPQPGLAVGRWQPQPQQLDAHLDGYRATEPEVTVSITLSSF